VAIMDELVCCEFPQFERFQTRQEKEDAAYEGCAYSDRWEDDDREAEQEEVD
jgi:hypothetical protein